MIELNEYSSRFADVLFSAFPEWRRYQFEKLPEIFSGDTTGSLLVYIPCPTPSKDLPDGNYLLIETADGEVTVSWDRFHTHFDMWSGVPETQGFTEAVEFLHSLITEEVSIAITMDGSKWRGAGVVQSVNSEDRLSESETLPNLSSFAGTGTEQPPPNCNVYVRSWLGTYDS